MQKIQKHYKKTEKSEKLSLKPVALGIVLILIIIGFYFSKIFFFKKNKTEQSIESYQEESKKDLSVPMILPEDLQRLIYKKTHQIIDIRSIDEFKYSHIENSKNIPIETLKEKTTELKKDIPIIVIDQIETPQGKEAVQYLESLGFSSKYLVGGIINFSKEGYSTISIGDPESINDIIKVNFISLEEANQKAINEFESIKFLDVRTEKQFEKYHIQGAINIPLEKLEEEKKKIPVSKLIIVDEDPIRSFQAAVRMHDMKFIGVYCLDSSLNDFKKFIEKDNESTVKESIKKTE